MIFFLGFQKKKKKKKKKKKNDPWHDRDILDYAKYRNAI